MKDRPNIQILKNTELWKIFIEKSKTDSSKINKIEKLIVYADELLERIIETFPTYTIHNGIHQLNIISYIENLLGDYIENLTDLECALILLSVYYHDIGMVFGVEEKTNLFPELLFKKFVNSNPEIKLLLHEKDEIPIDVIELYCRANHAIRVHKFLADTNEELLKWGAVSIRQQLGDICESHCMNIEYLKDNKFHVNFLNEADLRFCAILLRLGDILDFDNSRAPEAVYKYLGLEKERTKREKMSDIEWRRHLCTNGFKFPVDSNGDIGFVAGPDHPAVEKDVREFISTIENELDNCRNILRFCSNRWKEFKLPNRIKRDNILSQNYKFGEFNFKLEQDEIINILMGENLYSDNYIFIRELLQNSIDTSRHRVYFEKSKKNFFKMDPINIYSWTDNEGFVWFRIDDYGMGMNEQIIKDYFLKIGKSYYQSNDFLVEKLAYNKLEGNDFVPISKFGIGILSCFLIGDRVEISTKHLPSSGIDEKPIRMSIEGLKNYYILQTDNNIPNELPHPKNNENQYRSEYGTSVCVRINPSKEFGKINFEEKIRKHVFACDVPINFNDIQVNENQLLILSKPFLHYKKFEFAENQIKQIEEFLDIKINHELYVEVIPVDITKNSTSPALNGQGFIVNLNLPDDYSNSSMHFLELNNEFDLSLRKQVKENNQDQTKHINIKIEGLKDYVINFIDYHYIWGNHLFYYNLQISHNGIRLPNNTDDYYDSDNEKSFQISRKIFRNNDYRNFITQLFCSVLLLDKFRLNLSTSRELIKNIPWEIYSNLALSFYRSIMDTHHEKIYVFDFDFLTANLDYENLKLLNISKDSLLLNENGWRSVKMFFIDKERLSINDILNKFKDTNSLILSDYINNEINCWNFNSIIRLTLLEFYTEPHLMIEENFERIILKKISSNTMKLKKMQFKPLFFIKYNNDNILKYSSYPINENHVFSKWFITNSDDLMSKYPGNFQLIYHQLLRIHNWWPNREDNLDNSIKYINQVLDRLQSLETGKLKPSDNIYLKKEYFKNIKYNSSPSMN